MFRSMFARLSLSLVCLCPVFSLTANAQANKPGSESVRPSDSHQIRATVAKLLGWRVGVRTNAFKQLTFSEAAAKADALGLAYVEGSSNQEVSPEIRKKLDYNLSPAEVTAVTNRLHALNVHMPVYYLESSGLDENASKKVFNFAKSLGVDTIHVSSSRALSSMDKLADEFGINVAVEGANAKGSSSRVGLSLDSASYTKADAGSKERVMVLKLRDTDQANLSKLLLDIARSEPKPEESPNKCVNCSRPYGGTRPLFVSIESTAANVPNVITAFEKAVRPAMGYRVEQIAAVVPITSTDRIPAEDKKKIDAALPHQVIAKVKKPRKLLVIDLCPGGGYYHDTIAHANYALRGIGKNTGAFEPIFSNDLNNLKYPKIKEFDGVFLNSVVGEVFPDPDVLNGLLRFVREGGGVAGIHGSTYASQDLPEYSELMGAADGPHKVEDATLMIEDKNSPLTSMFKQTDFPYRDEFYHFLPTGPYSREKLHILIGIDVKKSDMSNWHVRPDNDYGLVWIKNYGKGRVYNCAFGHTPTFFERTDLAQHMLAAIQFILGDLPADATPSGKLQASAKR